MTKHAASVSLASGKKVAVTVLAIFAAFSAFVTPSQAASNPSFENSPDFTGWTQTAGPIDAIGGYSSSFTVDRSGFYLPTNGAAVAVIGFSGSVGAGGTAYGPSLQSGTFSARAGQSVSIDWRVEETGDQAVGRGFVRDSGTNAIVATLFDITAAPVGGLSPWSTATFVFTLAGNYFLDLQAGSFDSTFGTAIGANLILDNAVFPAQQAVPVTILFVDGQAIFSTLNSAIPMALAQRELALGGIETSLRDVNGRLFRLRAGLGDETSTTVAVHASGGKEIVSIDNRGKEAKASEASPASPLPFKIFASGDYGNTDREAIDSTPGFRQDVYVGTAGLEIDLSRHFTIGFGGSFLESRNFIGRNVGKVDLEGFSLSPYASYHTTNFFADILYSYGRFEHSIRRNTLFGRTAHADPESSNHSAQLNAGYNLRVSGLVTGPIASLDYTKGELDGYTEHNGGRFNTRVNSQNYDSLKSRLGWQASYPIQVGFGTITPQIRASWLHEFADDDEGVTAKLTQSPFILVNGNGAQSVGGFSAGKDTRGPGQDALALGGGMHVALGQRVSILADYEVYLAQDDNLQQFASFRTSFSF